MLFDCHTHNLESTDGIISIEPGFTDFSENKCYSCGIHPWKTDFINENVIESLKQTLDNKNIYALGEAGLDYLHGAPLDYQEKIFLKQLEISEKTGLPIILHCVRASADLIRLKKKYKPHQPWIFHGFRGGYLHAKQLIDEGFYISIGEKFNHQALKAIPDDLLLLETDESLLSIEEIASRVKPDALRISNYNINKLFKSKIAM